MQSHGTTQNGTKTDQHEYRPARTQNGTNAERHAHRTAYRQSSTDTEKREYRTARTQNGANSEWHKLRTARHIIHAHTRGGHPGTHRTYAQAHAKSEHQTEPQTRHTTIAALSRKHTYPRPRAVYHFHHTVLCERVRTKRAGSATAMMHQSTHTRWRRHLDKYNSTAVPQQLYGTYQ